MRWESYIARDVISKLKTSWARVERPTEETPRISIESSSVVGFHHSSLGEDENQRRRRREDWERTRDDGSNTIRTEWVVNCGGFISSSEGENKSRHNRRHQDRESRRLWWTLILPLTEKARQDGGERWGSRESSSVLRVDPSSHGEYGRDVDSTERVAISRLFWSFACDGVNKKTRNGEKKKRKKEKKYVRLTRGSKPTLKIGNQSASLRIDNYPLILLGFN